MQQCRHCLAKMEPRNGRCPVCGIDPNARPASLSPREKTVRRHARGIRMVAMFHLVAAGTGIVLINRLAPLPMVLFALVNVVIAFGLARYAFLAYKAAVVYYFLIGMVNVISIQHGPVHLGGIILSLIALYLVGNGTAKAIFERNLLDPV